MRQPTFSRSQRHTRRYKLARTGIGLAVVVVLIALIANLFGGKEKEPPIGHVAFRATSVADSDSGRASSAAVKDEADAIVEVLNDWFQKGFVDTEAFGEGEFTDVADHFSKDARPEFTKQKTTLTIGDARTEVKRVDPKVARASVSLFFEKGKTPRYATVKVTFNARATLKEEAPDLAIAVTGLFTLEKQGSAWRVTYWDRVKQTQASVQPSPKATT